MWDEKRKKTAPQRVQNEPFSVIRVESESTAYNLLDDHSETACSGMLNLVIAPKLLPLNQWCKIYTTKNANFCIKTSKLALLLFLFKMVLYLKVKKIINLRIILYCESFP